MKFKFVLTSTSKDVESAAQQAHQHIDGGFDHIADIALEYYFGEVDR